MAYVLDASLACSWVFADEATPDGDDLLDQLGHTEAFVPQIWRMEVLNVLIQAARRNRITQPQIEHFWSFLERLPIKTTTFIPPATQIIDLCAKHSLTAYDANYLALAVWLRLPLATLDNRLAQAALGEEVSVLSA